MSEYIFENYLFTIFINLLTIYFCSCAMLKLWCKYVKILIRNEKKNYNFFKTTWKHAQCYWFFFKSCEHLKGGVCVWEGSYFILDFNFNEMFLNNINCLMDIVLKTIRALGATSNFLGRSSFSFCWDLDWSPVRHFYQKCGFLW